MKFQIVTATLIFCIKDYITCIEVVGSLSAYLKDGDRISDPTDIARSHLESEFNRDLEVDASTIVIEEADSYYGVGNEDYDSNDVGNTNKNDKVNEFTYSKEIKIKITKVQNGNNKKSHNSNTNEIRNTEDETNNVKQVDDAVSVVKFRATKEKHKSRNIKNKFTKLKKDENDELNTDEIRKAEDETIKNKQVDDAVSDVKMRPTKEKHKSHSIKKKERKLIVKNNNNQELNTDEIGKTKNETSKNKRINDALSDLKVRAIKKKQRSRSIKKTVPKLNKINNHELKYTRQTYEHSTKLYNEDNDSDVNNKESSASKKYKEKTDDTHKAKKNGNTVKISSKVRNRKDKHYINSTKHKHRQQSEANPFVNHIRQKHTHNHHDMDLLDKDKNSKYVKENKKKSKGQKSKQQSDDTNPLKNNIREEDKHDYYDTVENELHAHKVVQKEKDKSIINSKINKESYIREKSNKHEQNKSEMVDVRSFLNKVFNDYTGLIKFMGKHSNSLKYSDALRTDFRSYYHEKFRHFLENEKLSIISLRSQIDVKNAKNIFHNIANTASKILNSLVARQSHIIDIDSWYKTTNATNKFHHEYICKKYNFCRIGYRALSSELKDIATTVRRLPTIKLKNFMRQFHDILIMNLNLSTIMTRNQIIKLKMKTKSLIEQPEFTLRRKIAFYISLFSYDVNDTSYLSLMKNADQVFTEEITEQWENLNDDISSYGKSLRHDLESIIIRFKAKLEFAIRRWSNESIKEISAAITEIMSRHKPKLRKSVKWIDTRKTTSRYRKLFV